MCVTLYCINFDARLAMYMRQYIIWTWTWCGTSWASPVLSRVYTIRDATWRDATRLGRMIGFQWNQQDRSHYARRDVTRRDGTRLRRPNWLLYPNNRAESRSKRDSLGFRHQRNPFPRIVTRLTRLVLCHVACRVDTSHAHPFRSTSERSGAHMYHLFIDEIVEN